MNYYIISRDEREINTVELEWGQEAINIRLLRADSNIDLESLILKFNVKQKAWENYVDFIGEPLHLVSEELKNILSKYDRNITFLPAVATDLKRSEQHTYWAMIPEEVECLSPKSSFDEKKNIKNLVLERKKVKNHKVFKVGNIIEDIVIIRLDVAESLLRRYFTGLKLKQVEMEA